MVLTAARSGEVRLARWRRSISRPMSGPSQTERMKANREHRVSLSPPAGSLLETERRLRNWSDLVFPSPRAKPLSDLTLSKLLKERCILAVRHGFRSSVRE